MVKPCGCDDDHHLVWMKFVQATPRIDRDGKPIKPPRGPWFQHKLGLIYAVSSRFRKEESYPFWEFVREFEGDELDTEIITLPDGTKCEQLVIKYGDEMPGQSEPSPGLEPIMTVGDLHESGLPKIEIAQGMDKQTLINVIKAGDGEASMSWPKDKLVQEALKYL